MVTDAVYLTLHFLSNLIRTYVSVNFDDTVMRRKKESSSSTHLAISLSRSIPVRPSVPFVSLLDGPQCLNYLNDCD